MAISRDCLAKVIDEYMGPHFSHRDWRNGLDAAYRLGARPHQGNIASRLGVGILPITIVEARLIPSRNFFSTVATFTVQQIGPQNRSGQGRLPFLVGNNRDPPPVRKINFQLSQEQGEESVDTSQGMKI